MSQIAEHIQQEANLVCAFPINGTRRWFMLEHTPPPQGIDLMTHYMDVAGREHIRIFQMVFDHGVSTLLSPTFGPDIMGRDEAYTQMALVGMRHLVEDPKFLKFYADYDVRVRFYGEYRKYFAGTAFEPMSDLFDELTEKTHQNKTNRLFWGVFAHDMLQPIADLSVQFFQEHGCVPQKDELIQAYYGESVSSVNFFIGFDKFASFDMPLLTTGAEDLYFTVAPSLYMTDNQFREILFDHLYARHQAETDYDNLSAEDWSKMRTFYKTNRHNTQGIGQWQGQYWYPQSQVKIPQGFEENK